MRQAPLLANRVRAEIPQAVSRSRRGDGDGRPGSSAGRQPSRGARSGWPPPLAYLFGRGSDLLRLPPVVAPPKRPLGLGPSLLDKRRAPRVVGHHGLPPVRNGCANGTGVCHLPTIRFGRGLTETSSPPRHSGLKGNVRNPTARTSTSEKGTSSPRAWLPTRTAASAPSPASPAAASWATESAWSDGRFGGTSARRLAGVQG